MKGTVFENFIVLTSKNFTVLFWICVHILSYFQLRGHAPAKILQNYT